MGRASIEGDVRTITHGAYEGAYEGWGGQLGLQNWDQTAIRLDLRGLRFVTPTYLLRLRSFIEWHQQRGRTVEVLCPRQRSVANYIARMHADRGLPAGTFRELPSIRETDRSTVLIPVTKLLTLPDVDAFAEQLVPLLWDQNDDIAGMSDAIAMAISELCGNAVDHGKNDVGCLVAAQCYGANKRVEIAIGDLGAGIPGHMRRRHRGLGSDDAVIAHALGEGVTGTGSPTRGQGFYWVLDEARQARVASARLDIRSGKGRVRRSLGPAGRISTRQLEGPNKRGTWIAYRLERGGS